MTSQSTRSQQENEDECHEKFYEFLLEVSGRVVPGESSPEQKRKVEQL